MPVTIGGSGPITGVTSINTTVSDTELGYLDGVSSALQTQINAKAADSSQGLYLITPSSIANSGGSASASGAKVTFSAVNSVSLNGCFSSTYDNYRIVMEINGSATGQISMRLRSSGSDETGSSYARQTINSYGTTTGSTRSTAQTSFAVSYAVAGAFYGTTAIDAFYPNLTQRTNLLNLVADAGDGGSIEILVYGQTLATTTAYDGFTVFPASGTITGTVRVYGYKN